MSGGRVIERLPSTVVRMTTDDGLAGLRRGLPARARVPAGPRRGRARRAARARPRRWSGSTARDSPPSTTAMDPRCSGTLRQEPGRHRLLGLSARRRAAGRGPARRRRQESFPLYIAVPLGPARRWRRSCGAPRGGHPSLPAEGRRRPATRTPRAFARSLEATTDEDIVVADANGGWRLQDACRGAPARRRSTASSSSSPARHSRSASRPEAHDPADGARRGRSRRAALLRAFGARRDGGDQPQDLKVGGLTQARLIRDSRRRSASALTIEDTWGGDLVTAAVGHLAASTPARDALHGLVHERLDERAHRRLPAAARATASAPPDRPGSRHRGRPGSAGRAAVQLRGVNACG